MKALVIIVTISVFGTGRSEPPSGYRLNTNYGTPSFGTGGYSSQGGYSSPASVPQQQSYQSSAPRQGYRSSAPRQQGYQSSAPQQNYRSSSAQLNYGTPNLASAPQQGYRSSAPQQGYQSQSASAPQQGYQSPTFASAPQQGYQSQPQQSYGTISSFARQSASSPTSFDKPISIPAISTFSITSTSQPSVKSSYGVPTMEAKPMSQSYGIPSVGIFPQPHEPISTTPTLKPQTQSQTSTVGIFPQQYGQPQSQQLQAQSCPPSTDPEANRALVLKAYQEIFGDHNLANLEQYFAQDVIEHNPLYGDGIQAIRDLVAQVPEGPQQIQFMRSIAQDDMVWTHSKLRFFGKEYAVVDIFRIECGMIKEHWDVLQETALAMPAKNDHPFF